MRRAALLIACVLGGCESLPKDIAPSLAADSSVMTTAEINATFVGHTFAGTVIGSGQRRNISWTQTNLPDGGLEYSGSDGSHDTGSRVIRDNASCEHWGSFGPGVEKCYTFVRRANGEFVSYRPDGEVGSLFHIVK